MVFDAWRQKKARSRRNSNADKSPPRADVQDRSPRGGQSPGRDVPPSSSESDEKSSSGGGDFAKIQAKYQGAKAITGNEDDIPVGKETIAGRWKLVEADIPTASHDEITFHKTPGFPENEDGSREWKIRAGI